MNEDPGLLSGLIYAVRHATAWGKWIVVVIPHGDTMNRARKLFSALVPPEALFSGRTVLVGKGKVSLVTPDVEAFVPEDAFSVIFLGWSDKTTADAPKMEIWRKMAMEILTPELG